MNKLNIAIIFGGHSAEYEVSLASAYSVITALNTKKYQPVMIGISREGDWFYYHGEPQKIKNDGWLNEEDCVPALLSPNRSEHKLLLLQKQGVREIPVDVVFPVLHGRNGEDGTVQGAVVLAGIPLVGCGVLSSALCMDKDRAHKLAEAEGIRVPKAAVFGKNKPEEEITDFALQVGFPLYVKPVKAGSSYGVTKVWKKDELKAAAALAFQYDDEIILEENIEGFEVGCAVLGNDLPVTGEVDEIALSGGFFDYTEKYTLKTSAIYVPARISKTKAEEIKKTAKTIYKALGCTGFARVDMFLTPDEKIVFNEVNTIPGFTEHSRYPGMMRAAGCSFEEILEKIIDLALKGGSAEKGWDRS